MPISSGDNPQVVVKLSLDNLARYRADVTVSLNACLGVLRPLSLSPSPHSSPQGCHAGKNYDPLT